MEERETLMTVTLERQSEVDEHDLVLRRLQEEDDSKKAWRLVGDVLVERTVKEMVPELTKQRDNLAAVTKNFKEQLEAKSKEVAAYQEKYNIRIKGQGGNGGPGASGNQEKSGQGVLVSGS
jgi:prefoldin subunit 2